MADQDFVLAPPTVKVGFSLEPVQNALNSLMLLNQIKDRSGFGEWTERTAALLTPERLQTNHVVFEVMHKACEVAIGWSDFAAFIDSIASSDAVTMRDNILDELLHKVDVADKGAILADKATFLDTMQKALGHKYAEKGEELDLSVFEDAYPLVIDPPAMQAAIVEHLRFMWDEHLQQEWKRVLAMLQESAEAFRQIDFNGQTAIQAARVVTGRNLSGIWEDLDRAESVVFVPSAHIGPYVSMFHHDQQIYVLFGARMPEGVKMRSAALTRSELLVRLSALADDTRLTILELLTERDELCAQDIITLLNLSQSSASRHLRQLTATGYLVERRREVAKCYSLNPDRLSDTILALRTFVRGKA